MFDEQIKLLEQFISDWDNVLQNKPEHNWALMFGICTNCKLGIHTLTVEKEFTLPEALALREEMWEDFPGYTGEPSFPICTKESYAQMSKFTDHPVRLELSKHCLQFLKDKNNGSEDF